MKKLKKFVLKSDVSILSAAEQFHLVGGESLIKRCSNKSQEQCSGICYDSSGHQGYCGWVKKEPARCACAVVYVEG